MKFENLNNNLFPAPKLIVAMRGMRDLANTAGRGCMLACAITLPFTSCNGSKNGSVNESNSDDLTSSGEQDSTSAKINQELIATEEKTRELEKVWAEIPSGTNPDESIQRIQMEIRKSANRVESLRAELEETNKLIENENK